MNVLHKIAHALLWIGGLNWGIYGLTGWEVGSLLGGMNSGLAKTVYVIVGLAAVFTIFTHKQYCRYCAPNAMDKKPGM